MTLKVVEPQALPALRWLPARAANHDQIEAVRQPLYEGNDGASALQYARRELTRSDYLGCNCVYRALAATCVSSFARSSVGSARPSLPRSTQSVIGERA